ncbi:hypothetical protein [Umezakia ovalisporum]|jgi:predicted extracellular nuclease|uniref:Uncharacterized protein n=2 Tax=Umezakia ovalisporum TaxID=75695 RepID=A0AA43GX78_9CYAN|nr:hypothetical protein [Umezakia ovalisporum]MBI1242652.1 hypothetical protein [Nostoc sp. RI_552]MDH6056056.1 hypothetical protein [Umezakia ovalisporum FSS-43]MDH6062960.1 hypothetical protein [Umezakia ovalisporum FSS-62]MDH6069197.1 hypothetical protein [Umezakia ovalisporum APH033B]MDH6070489.1 hypothetical protein [Umezakia ovalisporum CobakiLakeA]
MRTPTTSGLTSTLKPTTTLVPNSTAQDLFGNLNAVTGAGTYSVNDPGFAQIGTDEIYVFNGQWGSLDYALANASLSKEVTSASKWHINPDEPNVFDYNTNFKEVNENH